MKSTASTGVLVLTFLVLGTAGFAGWGVMRAASVRDRARSSVDQLQQLRRYAEVIQTHRNAPTRIDDQEIELTLLAKIIEEAADASNVPRQALDRIWPQPGRRVEDTPYVRKTTQVILREVSLSAAVAFMSSLTAAEPPLSIDALRFSHPARGRAAESSVSDQHDAMETWNFEVLVSYMIYQPVVGTP